MPRAIVRANAQAMTIDRRLFLASGTAAAVFGALHAALARAPAAPAVAETFDPAAYVAMWEWRGNVVYWDVGLSRKEYFALFFPDDATFPDFADIRDFNSVLESKEECARKLIGFLKARGQEAGLPQHARDRVTRI